MTYSELLKRFVPPIVWMGVIYALSSFSSFPGPQVIWWDFILKKTAHMVEYGILFFLWSKALSRHWPALLIVVVYAATDEFHQSFTPGRFPTPLDVGYDSLGGFLAYLYRKGLV